MSAEVPARAVAEVREQGVDAGVGFLLARFVLNFSVLYMDRVKRIHRNLPKLRASCRNLETQRAIITGINQNEHRPYPRKHLKQRALYARSRVTPSEED